MPLGPPTPAHARPLAGLTVSHVDATCLQYGMHTRRQRGAIVCCIESSEARQPASRTRRAEVNASIQDVASSPRLHFHGLPVIHTTRAGVGGHTREGAAHRRGAQFLHIALGGRTQDRPCHARRAAHERPYSPVVLGVRDRRPQLGAACRRYDIRSSRSPASRNAAISSRCCRYDAMPTRDRRLLRRDETEIAQLASANVPIIGINSVMPRELGFTAA